MIDEKSSKYLGYLTFYPILVIHQKVVSVPKIVFRQADSGISLDEQQRKIEARCLEHGWTLERVYVERGVSGSTPLSRRSEGAAAG